MFAMTHIVPAPIHIGGSALAAGVCTFTWRWYWVISEEATAMA
jgi:hypothetical protein